MYDSIFKIIKLAIAVVVCVPLVGPNVLAQDKKKVDSLIHLTKTKQGTELIDALLPLSLQYYDVDNKLALQYAEQGNELALQLGDSARIVKAGRMIGQLQRRLGNLGASIRALLFVHPIAKRNKLKEEDKRILNALAIAYTFEANYNEALKYNFESLIIREEDGNQEDISIALNNIGLVYFKLKNYPKALEFYERSLKVKKDANVTLDLDRLFVNIGLCYNQLSNYPKAQEFFNKAFKICGDECGDFVKIEGQFGLGVSYYRMDAYDEAIRHFKESYELAKKVEDKRFQAEDLIYLSHIYVRKKQHEEAIASLTQVETIAKASGFNEILIDTYKEFSNVFNLLQDFERASHFQKMYINIKDSIYSEALIRNLAKVQTDFAERENIKTIASKEEVIQRQRSLNFAIVIIAILASLLIFVLYRSNSVKKKVNQALSEAKAIIEDQNRQLLSSNYNLDRELKEKNTELEKANESLSRVNEELDNFIYKTSHDIRGPLASLKGMCNVALMDVKDSLALSYLRKLDITAEKLNTILTRLLIVNQINNSALASERIDFVSIVNDVLMLEKKKGLPPRLKVKKHIVDSIDFYSDKEFVRIILENLIDNAIKFYNDSARIEPFVDISVIEEDHYVKIKVVDNGIGISEVHPDKIFQMFSRASERSETGGIGLYITKTATEKLGGSVHLKTSPEGFTEFFVKLPLSPARVLV